MTIAITQDDIVQGALDAASSPPSVAPPKGQVRKDARRDLGPVLAGNAALGLLGIAFLIPLAWIIVGSFDAKATWGIELPHWTLSNFSAALADGGLRSLGNSLLLSVTASLVSTVVAVMAAYSLVRRRVPWKGPLLLVVLFLSAIPVAIIIVPVYQIYVSLGWLSILPSALFLGVTSLPFEIWLLKNYFELLPVDLEEAAAIERANTYQILRRVVLPLSFPGVAASAIFGFVNAWGSFIVPLVLISPSSQATGPITIFGFMGAADVRYGDIAAFSLMYSVPIFILYGAMSRFFQGGFVLSGGVRG